MAFREGRKAKTIQTQANRTACHSRTINPNLNLPMFIVKIKRESDNWSKRRWFAYGEDKETGEKFVRGYRTLAEATLANSQHTVIEVASQRSIMRNTKYPYEENKTTD